MVVEFSKIIKFYITQRAFGLVELSEKSVYCRGLTNMTPIKMKFHWFLYGLMVCEMKKFQIRAKFLKLTTFRLFISGSWTINGLIEEKELTIIYESLEIDSLQLFTRKHSYSPHNQFVVIVTSLSPAC